VLIRPRLLSLLFTTLALSAQGAVADTRLRLALDPGAFAADQQPPANNLLSSGVDLHVHNPLLNMEVDYDLEVAVADDFTARETDTAQRLGASARSAAIDEAFGVRTRMRADSVFRHASDTYDHSFRPGLSRKLSDLASLDMGYNLLLRKPGPDAAELLQQGYSIGLRGALPAFRLNWQTAFATTDIYRSDPSDDFRLIENRETLRMLTRYRILPEVQLQMSGAVTQSTLAARATDNRRWLTDLRTALSWRPSPRYLLDLSLQHTGVSTADRGTLLRRGSFSWFVRDALTLSVNYGDQLLEGGPALLLNTQLQLDALAGF